MAAMRIEGTPGEPLSTAYLWLNRDEAAEVRDAMDELLTEGDADWQAHISSADYKVEITVALDEG
jgi:hypothetical protein